MKRFIILLIVMVFICYARPSQLVLAAELGQELKLAPQDAGPSLRETLNWIKKTFGSLHGFEHWNHGGATRQVVVSSFDVNDDYIMTIKQKIVGEYSTGNDYVTINHAVCDMKEMTHSNIPSTPTSVYVFFNKNCIIFDNNADTYPRQPPFKNGLVEFDTGDSDVAVKLNKAFNHAAELFKKMPKRKSNDLF